MIDDDGNCCVLARVHKDSLIAFELNSDQIAAGYGPAIVIFSVSVTLPCPAVP